MLSFTVEFLYINGVLYYAIPLMKFDNRTTKDMASVDEAQ